MSTYRIIKKQWATGEVYYAIQKKKWWGWIGLTERFIETHNLGEHFKSFECAKKKLDILIKNKRYSEETVYETTD